MVNIQDVQEWDKLDNSQMKMLLMAYKTENIQQKMRIDILTSERNALMEKLNGVRLVGSLKGVPVGLEAREAQRDQYPAPPQPRPQAPPMQPRPQAPPAQQPPRQG